jgi:ketosteroid isomerase-like protein
MMRSAIGVVAVLLAISLTTSDASAQTRAEGALVTARTLVKAIETSDIELLVAAFDDEATVFMPFLGTPARLRGKSEIRQAFAALFKNVPPQGVSRTINPLEIATQSFGDTAIVTFLLGGPPRPNSQGQAPGGRRTLVLRRVGERWLIVHLHASNVS